MNYKKGNECAYEGPCGWQDSQIERHSEALLVWKMRCQYLLDTMENQGFDESDLGDEDEAAIRDMRIDLQHAATRACPTLPHPRPVDEVMIAEMQMVKSSAPYDRIAAKLYRRATEMVDAAGDKMTDDALLLFYGSDEIYMLRDQLLLADEKLHSRQMSKMKTRLPHKPNNLP